MFAYDVSSVPLEETSLHLRVTDTVSAVQSLTGDNLPASVSEQRRRWRRPVVQPLALCSQIQRSGGTLLGRLFDGHPACFAYPTELGWGKPHAWPQFEVQSTPDELFEVMAERWPRKFAASGYHKYSNWTYEHRPEDVDRYPFLFHEPLQRQIFADALAASAGTRRDVLNAYLTSVFNAWLDYQNLYRGEKRWITAFQPRLIQRRGGADAFFGDYPDGLLLTLIREPGSWLSSYTRHTSLNAVSALRRWRESVDASVGAHTARPSQVLVLLFEDLVLRTDAVMRLIAARMGLEFDPVLLEPSYNGMPVLSDSSHVLTERIDPEVTTRYRATLSAEHGALVERDAAPIYASVRERFALPSED